MSLLDKYDSQKIPLYLASGLLFCCLVLQLYAAWRPVEVLISWIVNDDTFYYLTIARNFVQGKGFSCDGLHQTNGFHPLWQFMLLPLALIPVSLTVYLQLVLTLCALLNVVSGLYIFRFLELVADRFWALLGVAIYSHFMIYTLTLEIALNGLESSLYLLALCLALYLTMKRHYRLSPGSSQYFVGLAWALVGLARLETIPFIGALLLFFWWRPGDRPVSLFNGKTCLVFGVSLTPYFLWNLLAFQHLVPVSALVKLDNQDPVPMMDVLRGFLATLEYQLYLVFYWLRKFPVSYQLMIRWFAWLLLFSLSAAGVTIFLKRRRPLPYRPVLTVLTFFALLDGLYLLWIHVTLLVYTEYCTWYYIPHYLFLILWLPLSLFTLQQMFAGSGRERRKRWINKLSRLTVAGGVFLCLIGFPSLAGEIFRLSPARWFRPVRYRTALWIRDNLPKEAVYAGWSTGALGFFSERNFINLDGLVNNYELLSHKQSRASISDYMRRKGVQYVVDYASEDELKTKGTFYNAIPVEELLLIKKVPFIPPRKFLYIFALIPQRSG